MKKVMALLLAMVLVFSLAACSGNSGTSSQRNETRYSKKETTKPSKGNSVDATMATTRYDDYIYEDEDDAAAVPTTPREENEKPVAGTQTIPALAVNVKNVPVATIKTFNGNITKDGQEDIYTYTAVRDGVYTFSLSEMRADMIVSFAIYDRLGERLINDYSAENEDYLSLELKAGETYTCRVAESVNMGNYILSIGEQPATVDISNYSAVNDSVEFTKQTNVYTFVPQRDGRYTLAFSDVRASIILGISVYDRLGAKISNDYSAENGDYLALDLNGGETYTIEVKQSVDCGNYTLNIGKQKATTNLTVGKGVVDSLEFDRQINVYTFTATAANHTLIITDMNRNMALDMRMYDNLDARVGASYGCGNGDVISVSDLVPNQVYRIEIAQSVSVGSYTLTIQ